jgi:ribosomal protein L7/L12
MDDITAATRFAALEAHVDWLYQNAGYAPPYGHAGAISAAMSSGNPDGFSTAVLDLVRSGNKISAIKQYREETGMGLREAKDAIDRLG